MKKPPSKVAHNRPQLFLCTGPAAQTVQIQKSRTTKRPLMQDWVFRLGTMAIKIINYLVIKSTPVFDMSKECHSNDGVNKSDEG